MGPFTVYLILEFSAALVAPGLLLSPELSLYTLVLRWVGGD